MLVIIFEEHAACNVGVAAEPLQMVFANEMRDSRYFSSIRDYSFEA